MWEITIKSVQNDYDALNYINDMLCSHFGQDVIIGRYNAHNPCLSIATKDDNREVVWDYLKRLLCDVFCKHYKTNYLKQNITFLSQQSIYFDAFVKVYTYFDLELEHSIAYRIIKYLPVIYLESYFAFRLVPLKQKWQDLCNITNNNASAFLSSQTFLSLLKFLIYNLDIKTGCVIVSLEDNCLTYLNSQNKQVLLGLGNDMQTICQLIDLSPQKIVLKGREQTPLIKLIIQLFDSRIEYLKN